VVWLAERDIKLVGGHRSNANALSIKPVAPSTSLKTKPSLATSI
jgi:hypothetical protein